VVKFASVETKEEGFSHSLFEAKFGFKLSLFLLFEFGNRSEISRVVVFVVTTLTPFDGRLRILRRIAYTTVDSC
jgi:hypothetical protein